MSISIDSTKIAVRTRGDGHWKKYTYQDATFSITLSGLLKFDDDNWTGWDMIDNQFNFSHILVRVSFQDDQENVRTVQGYVMIENTTLSYSPGTLVKDDFQMQGNGALDMFDGLIPCDSVVTTITVDGQTASDGTVSVTYTFTGDPYQVKYRIDNTGDYIYAIAGVPLSIPGLSVASHSIEIIPVCANDFEGTGTSQDFVVTRALTCDSVVGVITLHTDDGYYVTFAYTGSATQAIYRIDDGVQIYIPITSRIPLSGLSAGDHNIVIIPFCSNGVLGEGNTLDFNIASQPAQSIINWQITTVAGGELKIYVGGILTIDKTSTSSGTITAPTGAVIKAVVVAPSKYRDLNIVDTTLSTSLSSQTAIPADTPLLQYSWTANGDTYSIITIITNTA